MESGVLGFLQMGFVYVTIHYEKVFAINGRRSILSP